MVREIKIEMGEVRIWIQCMDSIDLYRAFTKSSGHIDEDGGRLVHARAYSCMCACVCVCGGGFGGEGV